MFRSCIAAHVIGPTAPCPIPPRVPEFEPHPGQPASIPSLVGTTPPQNGAASPQSGRPKPSNTEKSY